MSNRPTVSIGLPVFNGENYLAEAVSSLLDQTFGDFEIVISDNASLDATEEIARSFAARDHRIRYYRNETNLGANPNYNRTFCLARGEYFRWHAHDDICDPKYLELCMQVIAEDPSTVLVHSKTEYIDRKGDPLVRLATGYLDCDGFVERLLTDEDAPTMLGAGQAHVRLDAIVNRMSVFFDIFGLVRTADLRRTNLLQAYYGADKVLLAELALMGKLVRIDEGAFSRRCHPKASTRATSLKALAGWSDASRSFDLYPALIMKGYLDAVRAADLSRSERLRCAVVVGKRLRSPYRMLRGR